MYFAEEQRKLFVVDDNTDSVHEFDTSPGVNVQTLSTDGKVFGEKGEFNGMVVNGVLDVRASIDTQQLTAQSSGINTGGTISTNGLASGRTSGYATSTICYFEKSNINIGTNVIPAYDWVRIADGGYGDHVAKVTIGSNADSEIIARGLLNVKGNVQVASNMVVSGQKLAKEDITPTGTIYHNDTFTEATDTDIESHTPDVGNGYSVFYNSGSANANIIVSGSNGWARNEYGARDDNDGEAVIVNTELSGDYEIVYDLSSSDIADVTADSSTFQIIFNYVDSSNFDAIRLSRDYNDTLFFRIEAGALVTAFNFEPHFEYTHPEGYAYAPLRPINYSNRCFIWPANTVNHEIKIRKVGDYIAVLRNGQPSFYTKWDWKTNHKFGFGLGRLQYGYTGDEIEDGWRLSQLKVQEITAADIAIDSEFSNGNLKIANGTLNIGDEFSLPTTDGSTGQVMTTDGSGNVSWQTPSAGGGGGSSILAYDYLSAASDTEWILNDEVDGDGTVFDTGLSVTFTVPSSGKVLVQASAYIENDASDILTSEVSFAIDEFGTTFLVGGAWDDNGDGRRQNICYKKGSENYVDGKYITVNSIGSFSTTGGTETLYFGIVLLSGTSDSLLVKYGGTYPPITLTVTALP
jgi:hypothetical protein